MEDKASKASVLHELYVFSEWKPDPEYLQKPDNILPENISALWRWLKFIGPKKSLIDSITAHKNKQQKWHIALGDEGKVIAVLTDNILEIRTKRSEYATIAARTTVTRDAYPQWRKIVWSPDCSFIAVAYGNGVVSFFDLTASNLFTIPTDCSRPGGLECTDNTHAVAEIIFTPQRVKDNKWSWEVLVATYDGRLRNFLVSQTAGCKLQYSGNAAGGVSAAVYSEAHQLLYVAGLPRGKDPSSAIHAGLTAWRLVSDGDEPGYKLSAVSDALEDDRYQFYVPFFGDKNMAFIVNMAISPTGNTLVCLHCTGEVSAWRLPLLRLIQRWPLAAQPDHDMGNPLMTEPVDPKDKTVFYPADVAWWDEDAIILSRFSGAVSICTLNDLENILGSKPEFLQGAPRVSPAHEGAFVALECETTVLPARRTDDSMELVEQEYTDDTVYDLTKEMVKSLLYAITDMETFQPKPRRVTVVSRVYRLLGIKSTTPDELFSRKIESGKYNEALSLADSFKLDSDLVYQHQWRKTPVSADSIRKYLSKISKKIWTVHQCVDRLPETLPAAKELLQFGLELTNEEILKEINKDRDEAISDPELVTLEDLNAYSGELLRCRHVMLFNRGRLRLYEAILRCEKSTYVKDEYDRLRSNSLIHSAIELAKEGRLAALTCLWPHITNIELQMAVLEKVPETIDPYEYKDLLPTLLKEKRLKPVKLQQEMDWCKKDEFRSIWSSNWSEDLTPESEVPNTSATDISNWYKKRARQIEDLSGVVSHAVSLLSIAAQDRGVEHLDELMFHVRTLDTLVYDLGVEDISLKQVQEWSPLDTCHMLMTYSTQDTFVADLQAYVVPYLQRLSKYSLNSEHKQQGKQLVEYIKSLSAEDLTYALMTLRSAKDLHINVKNHLQMVNECLFAYNGTQQFDIANDILRTVPQETDGTIPGSNLRAAMTSLERLLRACACAWRRGAATSLASLARSAEDPRAAENVVTGIARSLAISPRSKEQQKAKPKKRIYRNGRDDKPTQQDWEKLLKDILELQSTFFTCLSLEKCHEIYALALLTSGDAASIKLASEVLTCDSAARAGHLVPYERSVGLVTTAAREYFNSASTLTDPALELARVCMTLIKDDNPQIKQELDLIAALSLLSGFNLTILPIQVRLCEDKMSLIEDCLRLDSSAYTQSYRLLRLAKLLRICADDDQKREGKILELVCSHALRAGAAGGAAAAAAARRLTALRQPAASLLAHVADTAQAHADINTRRDLYAAAATFCQGDAIEAILQSRLSLELEGLHQAGSALRDHCALSERCLSTDDEFADAITTPVIEKKDLVPSLDVAKKLPLLNYLVDSWQNKFRDTDKKAELSDKVSRCPEFYRSLYPGLQPSPHCYAYNDFSMPHPQLDGSATLISYYSEAERDRDGETEIVQKCAEDLIYKDTPLAVACLLRSTEDDELAIDRVRRSSDVTLAVCTLYAALVKCNASALRDEVYLAPPAQMARATLKKSSATIEQMALIRACLDKLEARAESERLKKLGYNVDSAFFINDADYRRETLFRMARSLNIEHLDFAYTLARKYTVDPLDVWAAHAQAAIRGAPLRTVPDSLLPGSGRRQDATYRMREEIWPEIPGNDYCALINFFTLLKLIDERAPLRALLPADHVRLLKKARAASQELDYKLLLEQPPSGVFLEHLLKILKPENVGLLAKFLRQLPAPLRSPVPVNLMYTTWLTKHFFSILQANATSKKWMQQYRQCASYFNKLTKDDILQLVQNTCFSDEAITRVPAGTRSLMVLQAVDYCQQEQENELKSTMFELSWAQVGQELARWARFLDNYHSEPVQALIAAHAQTDDDIWPEIEKSHGDLEMMRIPLGRLVLERDMRRGPLLTLLQCLHVDTTVERVFLELLDEVDSSIGMGSLVARVAQAHRDGAQLSSEYLERVMKKATAFGLPPHKQIGLLALTQRSAPAGEGAFELRQYTADLLRHAWPLRSDLLTGLEENLEDEEARWEGFLRLKAAAVNWPHRKALVDLLSFWPPTKSPREPKSLHYELTEYLLNDCDQKEALALIKLSFSRGPILTEEEIKLLTSNVKGEGVMNLIWAVLLSKCEPAMAFIPELLNRHKAHLDNAELEEDLIKELLDCGLFTKLVSTPLYAPILNYILSKEGSGGTYGVQWAISQLTESNFIAEAGHLQMMINGVPMPLRGFTQSVLMLKQYVFNKK